MEPVQQEKFSLKWNDFQSNLQDTFKTIRYEENLCDVTLMCGDDIVSAHKLVLSASSDLFLNLFRKCRKDNPIVILKGATLPRMSSLLDFIYNGEVKIEQDHLQDFLEVAGELKIKGLSSDDLETKNEKAVYAPYSNSSSQLLQSHSMSHSSNFLQSSDIQSFPSYEEICKVSLEYTEPLSNNTGFEVASSLGSHDYQAVGGDGEADLRAAVSPHSEAAARMSFRGGVWRCGICGKADRNKHNVRDHVETHAGNTHTYFCSTCGKSYKTKNSMRVHKYKVHAGEKIIQQISYVL